MKPPQPPLKAYIREYIRLLELEREAEKRAAIEEIRTLSAQARQKAGRALLGLHGRSAGRLFDLWLIRFGRNEPLRTDIAAGDVVLVSRGNPLKSDLQATVVKVGRNYIDAAFSTQPPKWVRQKPIRLDLFVNDIVYKRMEANLEALPDLKGAAAHMRDVILGYRPAQAPRKQTFTVRNAALNATQKKAVQTALGASPVALIHGPPGTGKTTTLIEVIYQAVKEGKKVLACADSNVAVDNLLAKLAGIESLKPVRIGHPARIDKRLEALSLAALLETHPLQTSIATLRKKAETLTAYRDRFTKPTPGMLRGMSKSRVKTLAEQGRGMRGISAQTMASMAAWIEADEQLQRIYDEINGYERQAIDAIFAQADVICATNAMVGSDVMQARTFDLVVIDEASQQIEPSTLLPLFRAPLAVLAGDHKQLPPTVVSNNDLLKRSLFERLMLRDDIPSVMLDIQYRMHRSIMDFPNRLMYDGKLQADPSVAQRGLSLTDTHPVYNGSHPVIFLNINGVETLPDKATSYRNDKEAQATVAIVEGFIERGITCDAIGVITPYLAQTKHIRRLLEKQGLEGVEVKSVDGFQGREKEIIIVSLVRSNIACTIGFVADARRLNVAMTRAKRKLILIGNRATLQPNAPFDALFSWFETQKDRLNVRIVNNKER